MVGNSHGVQSISQHVWHQGFGFIAHDDEVDAIGQVPLEAAGHVLTLDAARRAVVEGVLRRRSRREGAAHPIKGHAVVAAGAIAARGDAATHHPCTMAPG